MDLGSPTATQNYRELDGMNYCGLHAADTYTYTEREEEVTTTPPTVQVGLAIQRTPWGDDQRAIL